jgi:uncharacterized membrane protein YgcG
MSLTDCRKLKWPLFFVCSAALFSFFAITQFAQTGVPSRSGYVNDFAAVLDEPTRAELTSILGNLKEKTGIELAIVTVDSTGGQDIFDFSQKLAREWNVGARSSARKSLLMVLSVSDRSSFTQFSRSVQPDLPDGVLGDMAQRMRAHVEAGRFSDGVNAGVRHFAGSMAEKLSLNVEGVTNTTPRGGKPNPEPATQTTPEVAKTEPSPVSEPTPDVTSATRPRRQQAAQPYIVTDDADESEDIELTLTLRPEARIT